MTVEMLPFVLLAALGVFIASVSQVLLKKSALRKYGSAIKEYLNPYVIIAYVLFLVSTVIAFIALRVIPLSFSAIIEGTAYIYIVAFGVLVFKEKISYRKALGIAFIVLGVALYAFFGLS